MSELKIVKRVVEASPEELAEMERIEEEVKRAVDEGQLVPAEDEEKILQDLREVGAAYLRQKKTVTLRLEVGDIQRLRKDASEKYGLSMQGLISMLVKKYIRGEIQI